MHLKTTEIPRECVMTQANNTTSNHESETLKPIVPALLAWYGVHAQSLPWRGTHNPDHIWLSEIMLQQTQVETVRPYYKRFLETYPTIAHLAQAPLDDVLKMWEGLGYYSRARRLHQTAQAIENDHNGIFPQTVGGLMQLAGIGRYTAGAIASIAFGVSAPVLDGNVIRVFTRLHDIPDDVTQNATQKHLWQLAEDYVPQEDAGDYNQALMQLGQTICTPRNPQCNACPLQAMCDANAEGTQDIRPVKQKRAPIPHRDVAAGIIRDEQGRILIAQRPHEGLLGGLWEFPGGKQEEGETLPETLKRELREELAIEVQVGDLFCAVKHAFTHLKITLHAFECRYLGAMPPHDEPQCIEAEAWAWVTEDELANYSFGKADRMVIEHLHKRRNMLL
jgi:A/G-specific adenine glycosylase